MKLIAFIRYIYKNFFIFFIFNIAVLICVGTIEAMAAFSLAPVVDFFLNPGLNKASDITKRIVSYMSHAGLPITLWSMIVIFLLFSFTSRILFILARYIILRTKYAVLRELMISTFASIFHARWCFFTGMKQGMVINTFSREINVVGDAFGNMALLFATVFQVIMYLAVPFYLSWQVAILSIGASLLFVIPFGLFGKVAYRLGERNTITANRMLAIIHESLSLAKVILGFGMTKKSINQLGTAFDDHCKVTVRSQTLNIAIPSIYQPFGLAVLVIVMVSSKQFSVPLAETAVILYSLVKIVPCVGQVVGFKTALDNFFPSYEQVLGLKKKAGEMPQKIGEEIFSGFENEITMRGISFAYEPNLPVIVDLYLRIPKEKMIAIVGESGAGKSTLIDILMGFNEPSIGQITIDGIPLNDFDIVSYRQRLGYVPQDSILFNTTIIDNLRWASESATDEEIKSACAKANACEFIERLPDGYDTRVGDRGVCLSGGQVQRLALARALLREPELLILDEATSSLDTRSERLIQESIDNIIKGTTVVVIAHRLSTVMRADYIYVLDKGRIIEEGKYNELCTADTQFRRMVQLQAFKIEDIPKKVSSGTN